MDSSLLYRIASYGLTPESPFLNSMLLLYVERVRLITDLRDVYLYRYSLVNTGSTRN
jgi:hypothetical protein